MVAQRAVAGASYVTLARATLESCLCMDRGDIDRKGGEVALYFASRPPSFVYALDGFDRVIRRQETFVRSRAR